MKPFSRAMFATARFIAGSGRAEWVNAMAAEADSMDGDSTAWALGCLWASVVDRLARDWWLPAAVVLLPLVMSFWKGMIFFATSDMIAHRRIPDWLAVSSWILSPFPFAALFAFWRRGRSAYVAIALSFVITEAFPLLLMWRMGFSPSEWFGPHLNWYKCDPDIRIGAAPGIALDLLTWLAAVWLGSFLRRRASAQT